MGLINPKRSRCNFKIIENETNMLLHNTQENDNNSSNMEFHTSN
jgi:hypothetical protein